MKTAKDYAYQPVEQVLSSFHVDKNKGLSSGQAAEHLHTYGHNSVSTHVKRHIIFEFLVNFTNPLILILLFIVVVSFVLGDTVNGIIVTSMILLSVCLNFYQEHKASNSAEKLQEKVALISTVLRDGVERNVRASQICVGDILVLNAGDLIPADARIIETNDFFVNQSALTGESFPVEKNSVAENTKDVGIASVKSMIFSGTSVLTGTGKAIVVATGAHTEFGKIAVELDQKEISNSFTKGVKGFSFFILRIVLVFVLFIFAVNAFIKQDILESLTFAIAVAVGLTPEFLPMIMTVTMSKGAVLMAKKGVIVKKLTAIPTFGSMNILCTDKTGTITQDKIELVKCVDYKGVDSKEVLTKAYVNSKLQTGINNPLDDAIKRAAKMDISVFKKLAEIPFDFTRRRMSVVVMEQGIPCLISKGAPEAMLPECTSILKGTKRIKMSEALKKEAVAEYQALSKLGFRVLALAEKSFKTKKDMYSKGDEKNLTLLGFTAFMDPVKPNVRKAIDALESIGIEVKVVTGDNELVTEKACLDADIAVKGILLGHEITNMSELELAVKAQETTIFARFSPSEKERVIKALRMKGNVVGYMGDGINDAPSIKAADVGISVNNAVDVAKESADFILTHKSLLELKDGVSEGRTIFGNTMKYIMMGLSSNFGNMFSVLGAVLFLPFLPMLPIQILLNNFLYDLSQVTIPTDNVDEEYLKEPKKWNMQFIRRFMFIFGPISSVFDFVTFYFLYKMFHLSPSAFQTGWFMESLATQALVIHIIRTKKVPFIQSRASTALLISTFIVVTVGWILPYLSIGKLFNLVPLPLSTVTVLVVIVGLYLVLVEFGKRLFYRNLQINI